MQDYFSLTKMILIFCVDSSYVSVFLLSLSLESEPCGLPLQGTPEQRGEMLAKAAIVVCKYSRIASVRKRRATQSWVAQALKGPADVFSLLFVTLLARRCHNPGPYSGTESATLSHF